MTRHPASSRRLAAARAANRPGSAVPHTVVVLPSYSVAPSWFSRYRDRLLPLEHRQLVHLLALPRVPGARMVFVTSRRPGPEVLPYYLSLVEDEGCAGVAERLEVVEAATRTPRSISESLLERPDLLAGIRHAARGAPALIEPWNVTGTEAAVSRRLGMPLNGTAPRLWPLGFKSNGRRLLRRAGLPLPLGVEDVTSVDGLVDAISWVLTRSRAPGVVVKTDNGGAGAGNRVLRLDGGQQPRTRARISVAVDGLDADFLRDLSRGAVVEELLTGDELASPSVQLDIAPGGHVEMLSTHEQLLGGADAQVYAGCRFPANRAYTSTLTRYGGSIGVLLARRGVLGRVSVDFVATRRARQRWHLHALEINLRKGGTNHPYSLLQNLVGGRYDVRAAAWRTADGSPRCYRSTDNLTISPDGAGRAAPADLIGALTAAGLHYDRARCTGVVLHSLCALDTGGGLGLTAIGASTERAEELYDAAVSALHASSARQLSPGSRAAPASGSGAAASTWSSTRSDGSAHG